MGSPRDWSKGVHILGHGEFYRPVSAILRRGVRWQLVARNPADAVEPARARRFVPRTPTPEELAVLLEVADHTPYGPLARLAALTCARQGELLRLLWRDVNWEQQTLTVRGTKTERSLRVIDLAALAVALLRDHRRADVRSASSSALARFVAMAMPPSSPTWSASR